MRIGDFARLGQVSVRMLRHYDSIGLLHPARVDEFTGHRTYTAAQIAGLHRIVALKELGLSLEEIGEVLDDCTPKEFTAMLQRRRAELEDTVQVAQQRLAAVQYRLHLLEQEHTMATHDFVTKQAGPMRIAGTTATFDSVPLDTSQVGPLFASAAQQVAASGGTPALGVGIYDADDAGIRLTAGYETTSERIDGLEIIDLPATTVVSTMHLGAMSGIGASWEALARWCEDNGHEFAGPCRELYHKVTDNPAQDDWVTELQQPINRR
jgi:DNA-binding transcriptional MerR regulator/predicted transcriptional regulator YdeE